MTITVNRYSTMTFDINDTDDVIEAREKAIEMAENADWSCCVAWYQASDENGNFDE